MLYTFLEKSVVVACSHRVARNLPHTYTSEISSACVCDSRVTLKSAICGCVTMRRQCANVKWKLPATGSRSNGCSFILDDLLACLLQRNEHPASHTQSFLVLSKASTLAFVAGFRKVGRPHRNSSKSLRRSCRRTQAQYISMGFKSGDLGGMSPCNTCFPLTRGILRWRKGCAAALLASSAATCGLHSTTFLAARPCPPIFARSSSRSCEQQSGNSGSEKFRTQEEWNTQVKLGQRLPANSGFAA